MWRVVRHHSDAKVSTIERIRLKDTEVNAFAWFVARTTTPPPPFFSAVSVPSEKSGDFGSGSKSTDCALRGKYVNSTLPGKICEIKC